MNDCKWNEFINKKVKEKQSVSFNNNIIEPDLIINTSAEHMDNTWFEKLTVLKEDLLEYTCNFNKLYLNSL